MKYSTGGGITWHEAKCGIRIIYDGVISADETPVELHINATEEGVIADVYLSKGDGEESEGTESETAQETVDRLMRKWKGDEKW